MPFGIYVYNNVFCFVHQGCKVACKVGHDSNSDNVFNFRHMATEGHHSVVSSAIHLALERILYL